MKPATLRRVSETPGKPELRWIVTFTELGDDAGGAGTSGTVEVTPEGAVRKVVLPAGHAPAADWLAPKTIAATLGRIGKDFGPDGRFAEIVFDAGKARILGEDPARPGAMAGFEADAGGIARVAAHARGLDAIRDQRTVVERGAGGERAVRLVDELQRTRMLAERRMHARERAHQRDAQRRLAGEIAIDALATALQQVGGRQLAREGPVRCRPPEQVGEEGRGGLRAIALGARRIALELEALRLHELHDDGTVSGSMPVLPDQLDAGGRVRLGALAPLVDLCAGVLGARAAHPDLTATLDFKLHLVAPPRSGRVHGLAVPLRAGSTTVFSENRLRDDDGSEIGVAHVTFSRLPRRPDGRTGRPPAAV